MATLQFNDSNLGYTNRQVKDNVKTEKAERFFWKLLLASMLIYLVWNERISIRVGPFSLFSESGRSVEMNNRQQLLGLAAGGSATDRSTVSLEDEDYHATTFAIDPGYADRNAVESAIVENAMTQCRDFIGHYSPVAIAEMRQFHIPASILLAQALLESDAGASKTAVSTHNFFLRDCPIQGCKCRHLHSYDEKNEPIDLHPIENQWESFRIQCRYLRTEGAFESLRALDKRDYQGWAQGLESAGYSIDPMYAEKIIALIHAFRLDAFDTRG